MRRLAFAVPLLLSLPLVPACGGGKKPPPYVPPEGGMDGGDDGGAMDAAMDAMVHGPVTCTADMVDILVDANGANPHLAVAGGSAGFEVVWTEKRSGVTDAFSRFVPPAGALPAEVPLSDARSSTVLNAVVTDIPSGFLATWTDNADGNNELYSEALLPYGGQASAALRTTNNTGIGDDLAALYPGATGALLFWNQTTLSGPNAGIVSMHGLVDSTALPTGAVAQISASVNPTGSLRVAPLGDGIGLAYIGTDGKVHVLPLDGNGAATGTDLTLSSEAIGSTSFDLAGSTLSGAAVFEQVISSRHEVHFRRMEPNGTIGGAEFNLNNGPPGRAGSIARLAGGFAIAMRINDAGTNKIRVMFIDDFGYVFGDQTYSTLVDVDGEVRIRVDHAGHVLVAYTDDAATGANIRGLRLDCTGL